MLKLRTHDRPLLVGLLSIPTALALTVLFHYLFPTAPAWGAFTWLSSWDADDTVAIFTVVIAAIGYRQWRHFRVTERAYVKLSHVSDKTFALDWENGTSGIFEFSLRIKNFGRTPARVTAIYVACAPLLLGEQLPPQTNTGQREMLGEVDAFLVEGDLFYRNGALAITPSERQQVALGQRTLLLYGYVDYIDQFEVRHRAGYARQYDPRATGLNNLVFPRGPLRLNYDRHRVRGEGGDWDI